MKALRIAVACLPILGVIGAGILLYLTIGVSQSAVQEVDACALAGCTLVASYTLARGLNWLLDAFSKPKS